MRQYRVWFLKGGTVTHLEVRFNEVSVKDGVVIFSDPKGPTLLVRQDNFIATHVLEGS